MLCQTVRKRCGEVDRGFEGGARQEARRRCCHASESASVDKIRLLNTTTSSVFVRSAVAKTTTLTLSLRHSFPRQAAP